MIPSASDLTYFIEVSSALNMSRAAERLGISQPSLTLAVQRLEQAVGTPLFNRSKKGVTLTQPGKQLLLHARELLQKWDTIRTKAVASANEIQGSYTLGCHPSVALYSLSHFIPALLEKHPRLDLKLVHDLSRKITESVISMEVDMGIVVNPIKHPDLIIRKICDDEVTFWVSDGKRSIQDFRSGQGVLICDPDLLQTQSLLKKLNRSGIQYKRILATSSLELVTQLTSNGAGIGIIPGRVASAHPQNNLTRVSKAPSFHDEVCLIYRVENKSIKSIQAIADHLLSHGKHS